MKTLPPNDPSRRSVLLGAAAFTVAAGLSSLTPSPAQALSGEGWDPRQSKTSNGWPVAASENDRRLTSFVVEGLGMSLTVAAGDAAVVLGYVVRRFHYEVAEIRLGELKGYRPAAPEAVAHRSNYFSGSALEIKADMYPLGTTGGFFPAEVAVIRDVLAQCEGVVRWGADNIQNPQESHFELCVGPGDRRLRTVAAKFKAELLQPGKGPGSEMDAPERHGRRQDAENVRRRQSVEGRG